MRSTTGHTVLQPPLVTSMATSALPCAARVAGTCETCRKVGTAARKAIKCGRPVILPSSGRPLNTPLPQPPHSQCDSIRGECEFCFETGTSWYTAGAPPRDVVLYSVCTDVMSPAIHNIFGIRIRRPVKTRVIHVKRVPSDPFVVANNQHEVLPVHYVDDHRGVVVHE